jgi:hypothetical protein
MQTLKTPMDVALEISRVRQKARFSPLDYLVHSRRLLALACSMLQTLLLTFFKLLVMMTVSIILSGDPSGTTYIWAQLKVQVDPMSRCRHTGTMPGSYAEKSSCIAELHGSLQAMSLGLNWDIVRQVFVQSLQQSVVTEPIARAIEGLLFGTSRPAHEAAHTSCAELVD